MDDDTANELADLYDTFTYQLKTLREIAAATEAMVKTIGASAQLVELYKGHLEQERRGELPQRIDLLLEAVRVKVEHLRHGEPPPQGTIH